MQIDFPVLIKSLLSLSKAPLVKFVLTLTSLCILVALIKILGINKTEIPWKQLGLIFAGIILIFVFYKIGNAHDKVIKMAGYVLLWTTVILVCVVAFKMVYDTFFSYSPIVYIDHIVTDPDTEQKDPTDNYVSPIKVKPVTSSKEESTQSTPPLELKGMVLDKENNNVISDARIHFGNQTISTKADGTFRILTYDKNSKKIQIIKEGYIEYSDYVTPPINSLIIKIRKK